MDKSDIAFQAFAEVSPFILIATSRASRFLHRLSSGEIRAIFITSLVLAVPTIYLIFYRLKK